MKFRGSALSVFFFLFLVVAPIACKKEPDSIPLANVQDEFKEYVTRFINEAKARNVSVDVSQLTVEFVSQISISGLPYCGQALSTNPPHVTITKSDGCWNTQTDANKEILIFHELGHALLGRPHLDNNLANGMWSSMMHSGNQFNMYSDASPALRRYYLDELFNVNTPPPSFAAAKTNSKVVFEDPVGNSAAWGFHKVDQTLPHQYAVTDTVFNSAPYSLQIQSTSTTTLSAFSYVYRTLQLNSLNVVPGSQLTLKFKLKTNSLVGGGSVAIRTDYQNLLADFGTTQGKIDFTGTSSFTDYTVTIPYLSEKATSLTIYIIMFGNAKGSLFVDDLQLINQY